MDFFYISTHSFAGDSAPMASVQLREEGGVKVHVNVCFVFFPASMMQLWRREATIGQMTLQV